MPPVGTMPCMQYPVMAPTPVPTIQATPVIAAPQPVIAAPQPVAKAPAEMSKQDMIKLLLSELAKPDNKV